MRWNWNGPCSLFVILCTAVRTWCHFINNLRTYNLTAVLTFMPYLLQLAAGHPTRVPKECLRSFSSFFIIFWSRRRQLLKARLPYRTPPCFLCRTPPARLETRPFATPSSTPTYAKNAHPPLRPEKYAWSMVKCLKLKTDEFLLPPSRTRPTGYSEKWAEPYGSPTRRR